MWHYCIELSILSLITHCTSVKYTVKRPKLPKASCEPTIVKLLRLMVTETLILNYFEHSLEKLYCMLCIAHRKPFFISGFME